MRTQTRHRLPAGGPTSDEADAPDFFDGADRQRALAAPPRAEVSREVACAMDPPRVVVDPICRRPTWTVTTCAQAYPSLSNPFGSWTTDMSPAPPRDKPVRVAPPTSMAGMEQAIHHVLHGRIDPTSRIEHRELWQRYAATLIERGDPLGNVIGRAVLGDPIHSWFKGIEGAQLLGGLTRLGSWMNARWDRGLRIDLDGAQPQWTALERVATEFAFLRLVVHDLQPRLLNIVGETPRMESLRFTNQDLERLDLAMLERFGPLTALDLEGFELRNLDPLEAHPRIEQLRIAHCRGRLDLGLLARHEELIDLHVEGCPTAERWSSVPGLERLRRLVVGSQSEWTDIAPIRDCAQITELSLLDLEAVEELAPLTTMPELQRLALRNLGITSLRPLSELPALTELSLNRNHQLADFSDLAGCAGLEKLELHRLMWLRDLSAVVRVGKLRELTVSKCRRLTELGRFPRGAVLEELTLIGCPAIEELRGIETCGHLRVVRLLGTSIASVKDLVGLPNLEAIVLLEPSRDPELREALKRMRAIDKPADELAPDHPEARAFVLPATPDPEDA